MPSRDSLLARGVAPFVSGLWVLFVLVSLGATAVWTVGIGESLLEKWISNPDLRAALIRLLAHGDLGWITLAAVNVYLRLVESIGLAAARRWALLILGSVIALAWVSVATSVPLGPIRYGAALGFKVGPVPLGLPLFWVAVIIGAREGLLCCLPRLSQGCLAMGVGVLAFLTDLNLESLAAQWRGFWFWMGDSPLAPPVFDPPFVGTVAWGAFAALVSVALRERNVVDSAQKRSWQPLATLAIFNLVFLATHVTHRLSY